MPNYTKSKIYKICCNITNKTYIGCTTELTLDKRLIGHIKNFKQWKNGENNYITSFEILEGNDYYIELLEEYSCNCKDELLEREKYYIQNNDCVNKYKKINITKEYKKEYHILYYKNNKDKYDKDKEKMKIYRENNKDKLKEQTKIYRENNKDKIKAYRENNKDKMKEYPKNKKINSLNA